MSVSGSTDFSLTANDLVTEARTLLGIQAAEEPLQADELNEGLRSLNMMLKAWEADGVMAWVLTEGTLTLVQGDADYVFSSGGDFTTAVPMDITQMRITRNNYDLPMTRIGREAYYALPLKTTQGYPVQWYYDRQRSSGTLYVWPAPDATAGTLKFTYRRRIMDLDAGVDDFDVPQEWFEAVTYGLAKRLIPRYGKAASPNAQFVAMEADKAYAIVKSFDAGEGASSLTIMPDMDD